MGDRPIARDPASAYGAALGLRAFIARRSAADTAPMPTRMLSLCLLVVPGVVIQAAGLKTDDLVQLSLGTALQALGLWLYCRAKGRGWWLTVLALVPIFGWTGALFLRSQAELEALARKRARRPKASWARRALMTTLALALVGSCAFPRAALFPVHQEGHRLVQHLDRYREQHQVYPDSLQELGVELEYPPDGWRGIRYRSVSDGSAFFLTCFVNRFGTTAERATFDSRRRQWRSYN